MSHFGYSTPIATRSLGEDRRLQPATAKTIPFDYVFQFALTGTRGNKVQDVVEISTEGNFVALSVGYSLVLDAPRTFSPVFDQRTTLQVPVSVLTFGPNLPDGIIVVGIPEAEIAILMLAGVIPPPTPSILKPDKIGNDGIVIVDLSINTSSMIRVWDRTNNLLSQMLEVGPTTTGSVLPLTPVIGPNPTTKKLPAAGDTNAFVYGTPNDTVDVFLLRSNTLSGTVPKVPTSPITLQRLDTFSRPTGRAEIRFDTLPLPNTKLLPGDALLVQSGTSGINPFSMFTIPRPRLSTITLGALAAGSEKSGADLTRGFRLNPDAANLAAADLPLDQLSTGTLGQIFETGCVAAEEVSFFYNLDVGNTGREYQNKPIHNIAGLGIANGDRPFRPFAKPIMFEPRSFVRIQVEEISGPKGTLYIVLQGYKMLGTGRIPG